METASSVHALQNRLRGWSVVEDCAFTILIVEDDESMQTIYMEELKRKNRSIIQAYSAEEALEILKNTKPDMIILDIGLPKVSGMAFLKKLTRKDGRPLAPVFIVSGCEELSTRISGYLSGATRYFIKPVNMYSLEKHIMEMESGSIGCGKTALN